MDLPPESIKVIKGKISFVRESSFGQNSGEFPICIWFEDILYELNPAIKRVSELFIQFALYLGFDSPEKVENPFSYLENNFSLVGGNAEIICWPEENSFYFGDRHNTIYIEKVNFGKIQNMFIETTLELFFDLETERVGKSFTKIINMQLEIKTDPEQLIFT